MKFDSLRKFISSYSFDNAKNDAISRILPSLESIPAKEWFAHCKEIMKGFGFDSGRNTALRLLIKKCVAPLFVSSDALENVLNKFGFDSGRVDALRTFAAAKIQFENNGIDALSSFLFESHKNTALGILFGGDSVNDDKKGNVSDDDDDEEDEEEEDTNTDGDEDIDDKINAGKRSSSSSSIASVSGIVIETDVTIVNSSVFLDGYLVSPQCGLTSKNTFSQSIRKRGKTQLLIGDLLCDLVDSQWVPTRRATEQQNSVVFSSASISQSAGNAGNSSCVSNYAAGVLPLSAAAAAAAAAAAVAAASSASSVAVSASLSVESNVVEQVVVAKNNDLIKELIGADEIAQEQKEECVICNERKCKVLLEPCNHFILCNTCARGVAAPFDCPKCRKRVTKAKTIFL